LVLAFTMLGLGVALAYAGSLMSTLALASPLLLASLLLASLGSHLLFSTLVYLFRVRRGEAFWPCGCPLCSLTARRLTGLDGVNVNLEDVGIMDVVEPVDMGERVVEASGATKSSSSPPEASSQSSSQSAPQTAQSDGVLEALSSLEGEVKSLKGELASSLEEFRNAITAIKSEVDEIRNPFNFMRSVAEFLDEDTRNAILALAGMAGSEGGLQGEVSRLSPNAVFKGSQTRLVRVNGSWSFPELLELLLWLDSIYGSKDWDDLKEALEVMGSFRVVPEVKLRTVRAAMSFVERSRVRGERVSEKIRLLYMLAKQLGITGGEQAFKLLEYISRGER
jgi:hypothetical protein